MTAATFATYAVTLDGRTVLPRARAAVAAGHVLLPVRALGDALGATVTYDARTHGIVVRRGARRATFSAAAGGLRILGGRAYAPLRAAADAFGVAIAYDGPGRTIALGDRRTQTPPGFAVPLAAAPTAAGITGIDLRPADGSNVHAAYPAISARFPGVSAIVPESLHVTLDGVDVTAHASAIGDTVTYTPRTALGRGTHDVAVVGRDAAGTPLVARWRFDDDFAFASPPPFTPPPIGAIYLDRYVTPGMNAFDVVVRGEPGLTGAVAVDGVNQQFPLLVAAYDAYVAHVVVPQGVYQPFAHVSARVQLPNGEFRYVTLPGTVPLVTAMPQPRIATPAPKPLPRRPLAAPPSPATPVPVATPSPLPTMRIIPKVAPTHHIMPRERPAATPSPNPSA